MFVPSYPHPKVNEYHAMFCGDTIIMYMLELVEGRDRPKDLGSTKLKTGPGTSDMELMWRMKKIVVNREGSDYG